MRISRLSLLLCLGMVCGAASPANATPAVSTSFAFDDPVFANQVVCVSLDNLKAIAAAPAPQDAYVALRGTKTDGIPTCTALPPFTATVLSTEALHDITWSDGETFHAWAVQIGTDKKQLWVLYLEQYHGQSI